MTNEQINEAESAGGFAGDPATLRSAMNELRALGIAAFERLFGSYAPVDIPCHALNAWLGFDPRDIAAVDRRAREMNDSMLFEPYYPPTRFANCVFAEGAAGGTRGAGTLPERIWRLMLDAATRMERALAVALDRIKRRLRDGESESVELAAAVPDSGLFFEKVAATALSTPEFRLSLLRLVRNAMRGRILFGIEGPPEKPPAVQTCLALIEAVGRPPCMDPAAWERFRFGTAGMIESPGWARFWDLLILDSARRKGGFVLMKSCAELTAWCESPSANPDEIPGQVALDEIRMRGVPEFGAGATSARDGSGLPQASRWAEGDSTQLPARHDFVGAYIQSDRDSDPEGFDERIPPKHKLH